MAKSEYRKKLLEKYGENTTKKEEEKKVSAGSDSKASSSSTTQKTSSKSRKSSVRQKLLEEYNADTVDTSGVDKWFSEAKSTFDSIQKDSTKDYSEKVGSLLDSSKDIYNFLYDHKDEIGNFDEWDKALSDYRSGLMQIDHAYYREKNNPLTKLKSEIGSMSADDIKQKMSSTEVKRMENAQAALSQMKEGMTPFDEYAKDLDYVVKKYKLDTDLDLSSQIYELYMSVSDDGDASVAYYDDNGDAVTWDALYRIKSTEERMAEIQKMPELKTAYDELVSYRDDIKRMENAQAALSAQKEGSTVFDEYAKDLDYIVKKYNLDTNLDLSRQIYDIYNAVSDGAYQGQKKNADVLKKSGYNWEDFSSYYKYFEDKEESANLQESYELVAKNYPFLADVASVAAAPGQLSDLLADTVSALKSTNADKGSMRGVANIYDNRTTSLVNTLMSQRASDIKDNVVNATGMEWLGSTVSAAYSGIISMAQSATTGIVATALFGPKAGARIAAGMLGSQAGASGYVSAVKNGSTVGEAFSFSLASAINESLGEWASLSKLFSFGGNLDVSTFSKLLKSMGKGVLWQAVTEGSEEGFTEILNNLADWVINGDHSSYQNAIGRYMQAGYSEEEAEKLASKDHLTEFTSSLIGGMFGGFASGIGAAAINAPSAVNKVKDRYKDLVDIYGGSQNELVTEAGELGVNVGKYQKRLDKGKDLSGGQLSNLVDASEKAKRTSEIQETAKMRLTDLGEDGDISSISKALAKQAVGEKLSKSERQLIANSKYGQRVANELDTDKLSAIEYSRLLEASEINEEATNSIDEQVVESSKNEARSTEFEAVATPENAKATTIERDGKEVEVNIAKIASIDNGEVSLELDNGEVVNASEVNFGSGIGLVYEAASGMATRVGGFNTDTANVFVKGFDPEGGLTAAEYVHGFRDAYRYGTLGYPMSELKSGVYTSKLTDKQRSTAYTFGKVFGNEKVSTKQAKITSTVSNIAGKNANNSSKTKKGKVILDGIPATKSLNERQNASIKALRTIAEALGIDIHIFESPVVNGKRQGANGWYDSSDKSIHIDLYAGVEGDSLMLFTAAHELTHYIREVSPEKFKVFADFLLEEYNKSGKSVEELITAKKEYLKNKGRITSDMTEEQAYDLAYEEVIADSCEAMLVDSNAIETLAKLKEKDKGLWQTIKDFITDLINKINQVYKGLNPDSAEANYVREMKEAAEKLQALWVDALVDASNYATVDKALFDKGIAVNSETNSGSLMSVRQLLSYEEQQKASKDLAERFGVTQKEAMDWLKAETSMASLILNPKYSQYLDYTPDPNETAIKQNSDYPQGTVDFSPICAKRREFTSVMNNILRSFPNHVFAATDLAKIRTIMQEEGMTIPCGICYVEDRRQLDTIVAQDFIDSLKIYREGGNIRPDGKPFNANQLKAFSLIEGDTYTPSVYELVSLEGLNVLRGKDSKMAEAWVKFNNARGMQSVRLLANEAEYKRQILKYTETVVKRKNDLGGLRVYSFSDAEMFHLIDIIQVITDSATVGLSLQGYTKVNEYARAVKDTGEKLNRSLIPKGDLGYHMEGNKVVLDYDTVEGIDINHPDFFDNIDNPNVGNIVIGINETQIRAAMTSKFIDQIIPFHTGQSNEVLGEKGIATWENYKDFQSERDVKTNKKSAHQINIYTEVINAAEQEGNPITNKYEFVNKFLAVCKENGLVPRFSDFLNVDENGDYVYTEGYHKFLVDFKTFDQNTGEYLPQMPVKPIFDNEYITQILKDYVKSQKAKDIEVAKSMPKVIERITNEIVNPGGKTKYSDRTFSYDELVAKGDIVGVTKKNNAQVPLRADGSIDAQDIVTKVRNECQVIQTKSASPTYFLHVPDIGRNVQIVEKSITHGFFDSTKKHKIPSPRDLTNAKVSLALPEILANSIEVNRSQRRDNLDILYSHIMMGTIGIKNNAGVTEYYAVRSVIEERKNLDPILVEAKILGKLRAVNAKKIDSPNLKVAGKVSVARGHDEVYAYSVADFLEDVKSIFDDTFSEDVYKKLGTTRRDNRFSKYLMFSDRATDSFSNRSLLANTLESTVQNEIERNKLVQYKQKIDLINSEEQKLHELREQIKELSFAKGPRDTKRIKDLQLEANQTANRINTYDRQLLNLESTKALKNVLEREKKMAYQKAEKQGKDALARYKEKASETQRELMTRYQESRKRGVENRNKTEMRHKIKKVVSDLNQYLLKGTKDRHVPIELQRAVAEALDVVNMDTVGAEERIAKLKADLIKAKTPEAIQDIAKKIEHIQQMGDRMDNKLRSLKEAYDGFLNSDDPLIANSHDEVISASIDKAIEYVGNTPLRDMSLHQLEYVYDMYKMVLTTVRNANKAFKAKKSEEISVIANRVMEEVDNISKKKAYSTKIEQQISEFDWNNTKPVYAFERIGSDSFTDVFNNVRAGEDVWAQDMSEAADFRKEQENKHKYKSWDFEKRYGFTSSSGMPFELSLNQIMSLYAYSKRDQAKEHLKRGGIVFDETTEVTIKTKLGVPIKFNPTQATAYNLSDEILSDIINKLTPEQKAFVDEMQDYLSTVMGEKGNEVSLELYGVKLYKEKHYFPLKSATQFMAKAKEQQQGEVKIKNSGFSKETVAKANNPIVLTPFMDVWAGHVNDMSMYHAFVLALEDFYRVYNYKTPTSDTMATESVEMHLQNAYGKGATKYVDQLLKDLNGGARSDPRESVGKVLMSRFKKSAVMASFSVVIQQPSALVRAMALVDAKNFGVAPIARGVGRAFNRKRHNALWAEVKKYAPVAIIKEMGYFDTGMGKSSVEWLKGEKTVMDRVDDVTSYLPAKADELAWISIWQAVKRETARNNPKLETSSEEFLKKAGERFTEVIVKTQVYDSTLSKSANMRAKTTFMNMWTAFMAEPTTTLNMLQDALRKFMRGDKKYAVKAIGAAFGSILLNSILVSLVYAARDDDDDETYKEKYLSRLTTEILDGINPLTYIPFVKDIWSIAQGFDVERADMSIITELINSLQKAIKVMNKDTSGMSEEEFAEHQKQVAEALWSITDGIGSAFGIPSKNLRRDINGIINLVKTLSRDMDTTTRSLIDNILEDVKSSTPIIGWLPKESKTDKLYDAIVGGDTAYVERFKSGYDDEDSYNSAINKAIRENDPRIKLAAKARYEKNISEYMRIAKEIIAEGNFKQDNVVAAINAEVNRLKPESESEGGSVPLFTAADYYKSIVHGDTTTASIVKNELIAMSIAEGNTKNDAENSIASGFVTEAKKAYMDRSLNKSKAISLIDTYGGSADGATKVKEWDFEIAIGYTWSKRDNAYRLGAISRDKLISYIMDIGDKSRDEAELEVTAIEFQTDYPEYSGVSTDTITAFFSPIKGQDYSLNDIGMEFESYAKYLELKKDTKGVDLNGDGKTDSGTHKAALMDVIDSLPISYSQKDALYYLNGWTESRIHEAPWH